MSVMAATGEPTISTVAMSTWQRSPCRGASGTNLGWLRRLKQPSLRRRGARGIDVPATVIGVPIQGKLWPKHATTGVVLGLGRARGPTRLECDELVRLCAQAAPRLFRQRRPLMGPQRRQARSAPSRLGSYRRPSEQVRACLLPSQCRRGEDHLAVAQAGLTSGGYAG